MNRKFPYTIVVAEDFDDTRLMLRHALEMSGYHVLEATNGQEAVEIVQKKCPDLILMDLNMPKMDGLSAAERIRKCKDACQDVPILAITAYDTIGMKDAALKAGCSGYITKPVNFERLETIISRILVTS